MSEPKVPDDVISIEGDDPYWLRSQRMSGAPKALKILGGNRGQKTKSLVRITAVKKDGDDE